MSRPHLLIFACLTLSILPLCFATPVQAQCPPKTSVVDTLLNADGSPAAGRVVIAWPTYTIGPCQVVAGQLTVTVTAGAFSVQLYPNDAATPAGTSYRVTYYLRSGQVTTEYWVVPTSASTVPLALVRSPTVPVPAVMLSQAQITNLVPDLVKKVELPSPCLSGKFLQANGSASPPQVSCVDGTGAPLATSAVSGTVRTDVTEADPQVYTKLTADSLLAAKASLAHTHSAADTTSGVFNASRLPLPTSTSVGAVKSGACNSTDKVTGISTAGDIVCGADQGGGGGSSQHQVNGTNLTANDPINFQDSSTIAYSNPAAGNIQGIVKDSSITAAKLNVSSPSGAQLAGIGDLNIAGGALSPNRIAGTAEIQTNKGVASGYAALDATTKVIQDPANAQVSASPSKIPLADGTGKISDGWLSANVSLLGSAIDLANEVTGELPFSSLTSYPSGCVNQFLRALADSPTCASVTGADFGSQTANFVFAAPNGASGNPSFRLLVDVDIPNLDASKIATGALALARGGTNQGAWTAGRCVQVNAGGTALESAGAGCGGGSGSQHQVNGTNLTSNDPVNFQNSSGAGQINLSNPSAGNIQAVVADAAITNAKLRDSGANTVIGRAASTTGVPADVAIGPNTVLGRKGGDIVAQTIATAQVGDDQITYAKLQNVSATSRFLGRITAGAGDIEELTGTQATTLLDNFTSTLKGTVPGSGGGTTNFLRADGTWAAPPGGGATSTRWDFVSAGCNNTSAGPAYDIPTSNGAVASCFGTSPHRFGALDFADGASELTATLRVKLPSNYNSGGTTTLNFHWFSGSTSTNSMVFTARTVCVADGEDLIAPTYNTVQTQSDANNATANTRNSGAIASLTMTGCAAGETLFLRVGRDPTNGSDTLAATVSLLSVEVVLPIT